MNIGFKNFRLFKDLSIVKLAPITMLVGCNNSGKSSFIKGLLMTAKNLSNFEIPRSYGGKNRYNGFINPLFSFDLTDLGAGISTFERNKNIDSESNEFVISCSYPYMWNQDSVTIYQSPCKQLTRFLIEIHIKSTDNNKWSSSGKISQMTVEDRALLLKYEFNFSDETMTLHLLCPNTDDEEAAFANMTKEKYAEMRINMPLRHNEEAELLCINNDERQAMVSLKMPLTDNVRYQYADEGIFTHNGICRYMENVFAYMVSLEKKSKLDILINEQVGNQQELIDLFKSRLNIRIDGLNIIQKSAIDLEQLLYVPTTNILNIRTYDINHSVYYDRKDNNDFMANTIHRYLNVSNPNAPEKMKEFVLYWMEEFKIGIDFNPKSIGGEYYSLSVTLSNGKEVSLCDMGTGINKIMIMLLNLAIVKYGWSNGNNGLLVIEEPEQNLHPKYQSKLADLLYSVVKDSYSHIIIVVETHSEYLVRKSQVLVSRMKFGSNQETEDNSPFRTYYFKDNGETYSMGYRFDGKFIEDFGEGFYDESSTLLLQILGLEK